MLREKDYEANYWVVPSVLDFVIDLGFSGGQNS